METWGFLPAEDPLWSFEKEVDSRLKDLEFALDYIFAKVADPSGTGGTPFMKWLSQLGDETAQEWVYLRWNS
jgi:hypothetical protein